MGLLASAQYNIKKNKNNILKIQNVIQNTNNIQKPDYKKDSPVKYRSSGHFWQNTSL